MHTKLTVPQIKSQLWKTSTSVLGAEPASKTEKTYICTQKDTTTKKPKGSGYSLSTKQSTDYL